MSKTVIITGGSSGIGKACAIKAAAMGSRVIIPVRNRDRAIACVKEISDISKNSKVEYIICDLARMEDVIAFSKAFRERSDRLDVLINNAGVVSLKRQLTFDGLELHFGINHISHFLLSTLLIDILLKSDDPRIVNVSSGAHKVGTIDFNDMDLEKGYSVIKAYSRSKLANILFTLELSRRYPGISSNSLHPGAVGTNIGVDRKTGFGRNILKVFGSFVKTPEEGAQTPIYLAFSPDIKGVSGRYFYNEKEAIPSKTAQDKELAKKLWAYSENIL